jgi:DNA adenine methylase
VHGLLLEDRAMTEIQPKPFLKWAGGKSKSVAAIQAHFPATWNPTTDLYVEPFLGGGAMFFAVQPKIAILNDANTQLIETYIAIRDDVANVLDELEYHRRRHASEGDTFYMNVRANAHTLAPPPTQAAQFIFLNKAGFNGLYRVNKAGRFNVPWGKKPNVRLCDPENLQLCAKALCAASLLNYDFGELFGGEGVATLTDWPSAVIYCDPPYVPVSKTANFTSYTPGGFTYADQIRLLAKAIEWKRSGATVLLSQAADEGLRDQYLRCGFQCEVLQCRRNVNSKGGARGPVDEYLFF